MLQPELFDTYAAALLDEARNDPDSFGSIDEEQALQGTFALAAALRMQDKGLEKILLSSIVKDFLHDEIAFSERADGHGQKTSLIFPSQSTYSHPMIIRIYPIPKRSCIFSTSKVWSNISIQRWPYAWHAAVTLLKKSYGVMPSRTAL